jgi:hypothetical protein
MAELTIDTSKATFVGEGLKAILVGDTLVLLVDTKHDIGPSKSGKMEGVASTGGFAKLPAGLKGNVYVGR